MLEVRERNQKKLNDKMRLERKRVESEELLRARNLQKRQASLENRGANLALHQINKLSVKEETMEIKRSARRNRDRYFEDELLQKQAEYASVKHDRLEH